MNRDSNAMAYLLSRHLHLPASIGLLLVITIATAVPAVAQLAPKTQPLSPNYLGGNVTQPGFGSGVAVHYGNGKPAVLVGYPGRNAMANYVLNDDSWNTATAVFSGTSFGHSVASNGNYAVIGQPGEGSSGGFRILRRVGDNWVLEGGGTLFTCNAVSSQAECGHSVAISGNYIAVGAPEDRLSFISERGSVTIYKLTDGVWAFVRRISGVGTHSNNERFGESVALDILPSGKPRLVVGAPRYRTNRGQAYVFEGEPDNSWPLVRTLRGGTTIDDDTPSSSQFGSAVAVHGDWVIVGSRRSDDQRSVAGLAWAFDLASNFRQKLTHVSPESNDEFGTAAAIYGDLAVISAARRRNTAGREEGAVYIFRRSGSTWNRLGTVLTPPPGTDYRDVRFGHSVSITRGGLIAVGGEGDGVTGIAMVYELAAQPYNVAATKGATQNVSVSWTRRPSGESGYNIYKNNGAAIPLPISSSYTDASATPWQMATYCVAALNDTFGESNRICDTGFRSGSVTSVTATNNQHSDRIVVNWEAPPAETAHAEEFRVYRRRADENDSQLQLVATLTNPSLRTWADMASSSGIIAGVTYRYCVRPVAHGYLDAPLVCGTGSRLPVITGVGATRGEFHDRTRITWDAAPAATEGYLIFRDDQQIASRSANQTGYNDTSGDRGKEYNYCVQPAGASFSAADRACAPGGSFGLPPANVNATDGTSPNHVRITWTYTSSYETVKRIVRRSLNDAADEFSVEVNRTLRTHDDATAAAGVLYRYCVQVANSHVTVESCDPVGWRRPNGSISGRVATASNSPTSDVLVHAEAEGRALNFTSNNQRVVAGTVPLHNTDFTIEFWTRRPLRNEFNMAVAQGEATINNGLQIGFLPDNQFVFAFFGNDLVSDPGEVNTWHHWAVVCNRNNGRRRIFRDGVQVATDIASAPYGGSGEFRIGTTLANIGYRGIIDEMRVWNHARSGQQIRENAGRLLLGDEDGLLGYWRFDVGSGTLVPDHSGNGYHGTVAGTPAWVGSNAADRAPARYAAFTNPQGNYTISGLSYGTGRIFTVRPFKISPSNRTSFLLPPDPEDDTKTVHVFSPSESDITLNANSPSFNTANFRDETSFSVAGEIRFLDLGNQSDIGVCHAADVGFEVNGSPIATRTGEDGRFLISLAPGPQIITPVRPFHTFDPPAIQIEQLDRNMAGYVITSQKSATLTLEVAGGCDARLGPAVIIIESANGCFRQTIEVDGTEVISLPPLVYTVRLEDVHTGSPTQDEHIRSFFTEVGAFTVDLTGTGSQSPEIEGTVRFIYRANPQLTLSSFPGEQCPMLAPVLRQNERALITASVFESYLSDGAETRCPVTSGSVMFHDGIGDAPRPVTIDLDEEGNATYQFLVGMPNISSVATGAAAPFQKTLRAVAEIDGQFPEDAVSVIVTGARPRLGTFATVSPEIPFMILRDPPGDRSYSFVESGSSLCKATTLSFEREEQGGGHMTLFLGPKFQWGTSGPGFHWSQEMEVIGELTASASFTSRATSATERLICLNTTERFQTDDGALVTGPRADLFIGGAINYLYALADVINVSPGCAVVQDTSLVMAPNGFATRFIYSENHIRNTLIPNLETLRRLKTGEGDLQRADEIENSIRVWRQSLALNIDLKEDADFVENKSFSAGPGNDWSLTTTRTQTRTIDFDMVIEQGIAAKLGVKVGGVGGEVGLRAAFRQTIGESKSTISDTTNTVGYHLSDSSPGDFYSVDVKRDPVYGTPVFDLVSATTSCPWEPWIIDPDDPNPPRSQRRDLPRLLVNGARSAERSNVDPGSAAAFTLTLQNLSESGETRQYAIRALQEFNPDGATFAINGESNPDFFIPSNQSQQAILTVNRGPETYIHENLKVMLYSPCEYAGWTGGGPLYAVDTVSVTVRYQQPCTPIRLAAPADGWLLNRAGNGRIRVTLADFDRTNPELESISLQYMRAGDQTWVNLPSATFIKQPNGTWLTETGETANITENTYTFVWTVPAGLADGDYRLRAIANCATLGRYIAAGASGTVDRTPPQVFGKPTPADLALRRQDDIGITFSKPIDCATLSSDRFMLANYFDGSRVPLEWVCSSDRTRIVFNPFGIAMDELNGSVLQMSIFGPMEVNNVLRGVRDLSGNLLQNAVSWQFKVNYAPIEWLQQAPLNLAAGTSATAVTSLRNTEVGHVAFSLQDVPPWITAEPSSGVIPSGGEVPIVLETSSLLTPGSYEGIITADTDFGALPLRIRVRVSETDPNAPIVQQVPLVAGWNWFTVGVLADQMALDSMMASLEGVTDGDRIVGLTGESRYDSTSERWVGDVPVLMEGRSYRLFRQNPGLLRLEGRPLDATRSMSLSEGWNWIGFFHDLPLGLNQAFSLIHESSHDGDVLKGPSGFSMFDAAAGSWYGNVVALSPARGYRLLRGSPGTLRFPSGSMQGALLPGSGPGKQGEASPITYTTEAFRAARRDQSEPPEWNVEPANFEFDMSMVIGLSFADQPTGTAQTLVAAMIGEEVRGVTQMVYVPSVERHLAFLTVHGNLAAEDQPITIAVFDMESGRSEVFPLTETFRGDHVIGRIVEPLTLDASGPVAVEDGRPIPTTFELGQNYPNPFNPTTQLTYDVPETAHVRIVIYDVAGREVAHLVDQVQPAGRHTVTFDAGIHASGVYFYRMEAGDFSRVRKMVLIK
jgi:hypothetical protein